MIAPRRFSLLSSCLCFALLCACQMSDEQGPDAPDTELRADTYGVGYTITTSSPLSNEQIHALAQFIEAEGQDVHQAKVKVIAEDDAPPVIELELWGVELPGENLEDNLRAEFGFLADAQFSSEELEDGPEEGGLGHGIESGDDPETIKQKIIDDLRAQGVEGEIDVTVTATEDGHHQVEVEVHQDE